MKKIFLIIVGIASLALAINCPAQKTFYRDVLRASLTDSTDADSISYSSVRNGSPMNTGGTHKYLMVKVWNPIDSVKDSIIFVHVDEAGEESDVTFIKKSSTGDSTQHLLIVNQAGDTTATGKRYDVAEVLINYPYPNIIKAVLINKYYIPAQIWAYIRWRVPAGMY